MKIYTHFITILAILISLNSTAQTSSIGDTLFSFNAGVLTPTPDRNLNGVEFAEGYFWATGSDPDDFYQHKLYKFSADGQTLVEYWDYGLEFAGWSDLAYDGQYLYVADIDTIRQIDMTNGQKTGVTIPGPEYYLNGLAYDTASGTFWVSGDGNIIYEINDEGTIVNSLSFILDLPITGLAWDTWTEGGPYLWVWSMKYTPTDVRPKAFQMSPQSGMLTGLTFEGEIMHPSGIAADYSLGATITDELIPGKVAFVGMQGSSYQANNDQLDWVVAYDLDPEGVGIPGPQVAADPPFLTNELVMGDSMDVMIEISNLNDEFPLEWYAALEYSGLTDTSAVLGDTLQFSDATAITPDTNSKLNSIAFLDDHIYVSSRLDFDDQFKIYKMVKDGSAVVQTFTLYSAFNGWTSMTSDDQFLYGAEQYSISKFDPSTGSIVENYLKNSFTASGLAYDPQMEHFYMGSGTGAIKVIDKSGDEVNFYITPYDIEGLAWDDSSPGSPYLWAYYLGQNGATMHAVRLDPQTGVTTGVNFLVVDLNGDSTMTDTPLDIIVTPDWQENKLVMIALQESDTQPGDGNDKVVVYDLATTPPPGWIGLISVTNGTIDTLQSDTLNVRLWAIMEDTLMIASIIINSNDVINYDLEIPVNTTMLPLAVDIQEQFAGSDNQLLKNIYPVPASGQTTIEVNPTEEPLDIFVFSSFGQVLITDRLPPEKGRLSLNLAGLPSGVYQVVVRSANKRETRIISVVRK
jgi:hypothetical protein